MGEKNTGKQPLPLETTEEELNKWSDCEAELKLNDLLILFVDFSGSDEANWTNWRISKVMKSSHDVM